MNEVFFEVKQVKKYFPIDRDYVIKAVDDVSFQIKRGEILGLVGESGCGKSTLARIILGLHKSTGGGIFYRGLEISDPQVYLKHMRIIQKNIQMIFQDSDGALNPRMTVEECIAEPLMLMGQCRSPKEAASVVTDLLLQVGLEERYRYAYPGSLSGGQRQRIGIARCIGVQPDLIIADEPIASLDVSIQAQIINLLQNLQEARQFSMLFIAHDLAMVRHICDRVCVMYRGKIVESGPTEEVFSRPCHGYTKMLLASILRPDPQWEREKRKYPYSETIKILGNRKVRITKEHWVLEE